MEYDYSDFDITGAEEKIFTIEIEDDAAKHPEEELTEEFGNLINEPRMESVFAILNKQANTIRLKWLFSVDKNKEIPDIGNASINFWSADYLEADGDYFAFGIWSKYAGFTPEMPEICDASMKIGQIYHTACERHLEQTVRRLIKDIKLAIRTARETDDARREETDDTYLEAMNGFFKSCRTETDFEAITTDELGSEPAKRFFRKTKQFLMDRIPITLLDRFWIYMNAVYRLARACSVQPPNMDIFFERLDSWAVGVFWYDKYLEYIYKVCN